MDYSKYVKTPEGDEYNQIIEYQKALNGNNSSVLEVSAPLGMRYFYNSGSICDDSKNEEYLFVNAKPENQTDYTVLEDCDANCSTLDSNCKRCLPKNSIYSSALYNLDQISQTINENNPKKCKEMRKETIDENGNKKFETRYGKETFVAPRLDKMDTGQRFFIGSFAVIGLFLFYKACYKK
jgi:hypothetical protein